MRAPEFSADWYRDVTEWAHGTPSWLHSVADVGTDAGLLLFAVLFVAGWWRARGGDERAMGLALLAPFAMVGAYLVSEVSKSFLQEERPCRAVAGAMNIAACPSPGDWSFPSNHATIAAASAAAIVVAWRRMAPLVLPLAALMAFSRVFVGVHYPHDVAAGFVVGVVVAPLVALVLVRAAAPLVAALRRVPVGALALGAGPTDHGAPVPAGTVLPGAVPAGTVPPGAVAAGRHAAPAMAAGGGAMPGRPGTPGPAGMAGQPGTAGPVGAMGQPGAMGQAPANGGVGGGVGGVGGYGQPGVHGTPGAPGASGAPAGGPGAMGAAGPGGQAAETMPDVMANSGKHRRPPA